MKKATKKAIKQQQKEIEHIKDLDKVEFPKQKKPKKSKKKKEKSKFKIKITPGIPERITTPLNDELLKHEVRERIHFVQHNLDFLLLDHPTVIENKEIDKLLNKAFTALDKAYHKSM